MPLSASSENKVVAPEVENPMVNAYFNQFGRPFIAGNPPSVLQEQTSEIKTGIFEPKGSAQRMVSKNEVKNTKTGAKTSAVVKQPVKQEVNSNKRNVVKASARHHTPPKTTKNSSKRSRQGRIGLRDSMFVD
jgi:hypothetical protein